MFARRAVAVIMFLGFAIFGCGSKVRVPANFLDSAEQAQVEAYGGWVRVELVDTQRNVEGELIAVHANSVYVLLQDGSLEEVPTSQVRKLTVVGYNPGSAGGIALWAVLGTLSTASHGVFLVFTAPLWIIVGTIAGSTVDDVGIREYTSRGSEPPGTRAPTSRKKIPPMNAARAYARFPAGLPDGLARTTLRVKPSHAPPKPPPRSIWK